MSLWVPRSAISFMVLIPLMYCGSVVGSFYAADSLLDATHHAEILRQIPPQVTYTYEEASTHRHDAPLILSVEVGGLDAAHSLLSVRLPDGSDRSLYLSINASAKVLEVLTGWPNGSYKRADVLFDNTCSMVLGIWPLASEVATPSPTLTPTTQPIPRRGRKACQRGVEPGSDLCPQPSPTPTPAR